MPHHHQFNLYGTKKTFIQNTDNAKIFSSREKNKNSIILNKNISIMKRSIFCQTILII